MRSRPENESRETMQNKMRHGFSIGQEVGGRYQIIERLGEGGMGLVYRVKQIFLNREFALKTIDKRELSELAIRRFQQEARTTFALDHPNIIKVNDFGVLDDQTPFLVMELVRGETFGDRLKRQGVLTVEQAIPIFVQVCFGLAYAHEHGIVHRDIKPSNLMFVENVPSGADGSIKILDFGIAKLAEHEGGEIQALTRTGEIFGSPLYMSPEQCSGAKSDHRSDIYSLGCVFFEMLTGAPPCVGDTALVTMMRHQTEVPLTLKQASMGFDFPQALESIISTMLAKRPEDRYQNLGLVAHDLGALLRGHSVATSKKPDNRESVAKPRPDQISMTGLNFFLLLTSIAALAFVGGYLLSNLRDEKVIAPQTATSEPKAAGSLIPAMPPLDAFDKTEVTDAELAGWLAHREASGKFMVKKRKLTDSSFKLLGAASNIHELALRGCVFKGESLRFLDKSQLLKFDFSESPMDDAGITELCKITNLIEVNADRTNLSRDKLMKLATIKSLQNVYVNWTQVNDSVLRAFARLPHLRALDVRHDRQITAQGFKALESTKLGWLEIADTNIDDVGMRYIAKNKSLDKLYLDSTNVGINGLIAVCKATDVRTVTLNNCPNLKPADLVELGNSFHAVHFQTARPVEVDMKNAAESLTKM